MSINDVEFSRLLHDLKRIEKVIEIIGDEDNKERRKVVVDLLRNEFDRLYEDIQEARLKNGE
jgi:hypothetical protein